MTFERFFIHTYPGFFFEALPFAVLGGVIFAFLRYHGKENVTRARKLATFGFGAYLTGLALLVIFLGPLCWFWSELLYMKNPGVHIQLFQPHILLVPDFWTHIDEEVVGNVLAFLPFGILCPLAFEKLTLPKTVLAGFGCSLTIELLQCVVSRYTQTDDVILNTLGTLIGALAVFGVRALIALIRKLRAQKASA